MQLNVNTDAVVAFTNKLEKLHRSAFPVAVRQTLNAAAFDAKQVTIQQEAKDAFVQRRPSFFRAATRVNQAAGFDISSMQSMVGFHGSSQAVEDMEQQERGGKIEGRSFIPMRPARVSNSDTKSVRANARISRLKIVSTSDTTGKNEGQKFIKSVLFAGVGGLVLSQWNGKSYLWKVNNIKRDDKGKFDITPLYTYDKGRSVAVKATGFMKQASEASAAKMEKFFIQAAEKQFAKALQ